MEWRGSPGRAVGRFASVIRCDNPGPMELDGTNTWLLALPGSDSCFVVDPGPAGHPDHLEALAQATAGMQVALMLVTHGHPDHVGMLDDLASRTDAPARAFSADHCREAPPLTDGEAFEVAGLRVRVLHTPGHTADSVSLLVEGAGQRVVVSGDTILGVGTPVLDERRGSLRAYLSSLDALLAVGPARLLPGHGPDHPDLLPVVRAYRVHRERRLSQVRDHLAAQGLSAADADPRSVARHIYPGISKDLMDAAGMSARAQLDHLADLGPG